MRIILKPWNDIAKRHHLDKMLDDAAKMAYDLCEPYTPKDTGQLINSATISHGEIRYSAPYARRWYYQPAHFQGAPKRGNYWFERMKNEGGALQIEQMIAQKYGVKVK